MRARLLTAIFTPMAAILKDYSLEDVLAANAVGISVATLAFGELAFRKKGMGTLFRWSTRSASLVCLSFALYVKILLSPPIIDVSGYQALKIPSEWSQLPSAPNLAGLQVRADGPWFKDQFGRTLLLRGVNLAGTSKLPRTPDGSTYKIEGFFDTKNVSFVGRPFPLEEADEHFSRLRMWGLTVLRLIVTWEAVEHAGPGLYDVEYLEYLRKIVRKAGEYGITCFIDPHQDVWSRWTGGDGAPAWTLELLGMDIRKLYASGAAVTHQELGDPFPKMVWGTNYFRYATATMFSLFFAGDDFAPRTRIHGKPVQGFLQDHYIKAMVKVAEHLKDEKNVIGFDTLNEPSAGFVGIQDLSDMAEIRLGWSMSSFQAISVASGFPQTVERFSLPFVLIGMETLNPQMVSLFIPGKQCVWRENGVWDVDQTSGRPVLVRPNHFARRPNGEKIRFVNDYMVPFFRKYAEAIREVMPNAIVFAEPHVDMEKPLRHDRALMRDVKNFAWAPHWYDGVQLMTKSFRSYLSLDYLNEVPVFGHAAQILAFSGMMNHLKEDAKDISAKGAPTLLGEVGIAFDMSDKQAFKTGDFSSHIMAADTIMRAIERCLLSFTWWNYTPDNTNQRGDMWNDEDLSIFSRDQITDPDDAHSGGRALPAIVRPFPIKIAGEPLRIRFRALSEGRKFSFEFIGDNSISEPTEVYIPQYQYPDGATIRVSDGSYEWDEQKQTLKYWHSNKQDKHKVTITRRRK